MIDRGYQIVYEPNALVYHQFAASHVRSKIVYLKLSIRRQSANPISFIVMALRFLRFVPARRLASMKIRF